VYVGGSDIAAGGMGTLTVEGGGLVDVGGTLQIWNTGTVELLNVNSRINCGSFDNSVGGIFTHTDGTLTVDGGSFDPGTSDYSIGTSGGNPTLTLTGTASASFTMVNIALQMGSAGTINVRDGAQLAAGSLMLSRMPNSSGTLSVEGGEVGCTGMLSVGTMQGTGELNINAGGLLTAQNVTVGADMAPAMGTVTIDGGTLDVTTDLSIRTTGQINLLDGSIQAGFLDAVPGQFNWTGGRLSMFNFVGNLNNQGGILAPGSPLGLTEVLGDYTQAATAVLEIDLAGTDPSQYDRLYVEGAMTLAGILDVIVDPAFETEIAAGDEFQILDMLDWGLLSGTFDDLTPLMVPDLEWDDSELYTAGILRVLTTNPVPGDANRDGQVNEEDATALASNWGDPGGWTQGDFNDDGQVNAADASILAANWGYGTSESTVVPEPGVLVTLLGMAALALLWRRRSL